MSPTRYSNQKAARAVIVSLDDKDEGIQVGKLDPGFQAREFLEELDQMLTEEERHVIGHLIRNEHDRCDDFPLTLPEKRFKLLVASIRAKGRSARDRAW